MPLSSTKIINAVMINECARRIKQDTKHCTKKSNSFVYERY